MRNWKRYFIAFAWFALVAGWDGLAQAEPIKFTVDKLGVRALSFTNTNNFTVYYVSPATSPFGANPTPLPLVKSVAFLNTSGLVVQDTTPVVAQTLDADGLGNLTTFAWGSVHLRFSAMANHFDISATVSNASDNTLDSLALDIINLKLLSTPLETNGINMPIWRLAPGDPGIFSLTHASSKVVVVNNDVVKPLVIGVPWAADKPVSTIFPVCVLLGHPAQSSSGVAFFSTDIATARSIAPRSSDSFQMSLRFGESTDTIYTLAGDINDKFLAQYPFKLIWPDRRPIGMDNVATSAKSSASNPRGWFSENASDFVSPSGLVNFKSKLMARVQTNITNLKAINAQGIILWNIEGGEFNTTSYYGDPQKVETMAPEMDAVIDDVFKAFRDAGFRVGVTIRPQTFAAGNGLPADCHDQDVFIKTNAPFNQKWHECKNSQWVQMTYSSDATLPATCTNDQIFFNKSAPPLSSIFTCESGSWTVDNRFWQKETTNYVPELFRKISYAKKRWNATLFYIDTYLAGVANYHDMVPENFQGLNQVAEAFPDVLLIPEHSNAAYFSVSMPYLSPTAQYGTRDDVLSLYPSAGSAIRFDEVIDPLGKADILAASVSRGDLLLVNTCLDPKYFASVPAGAGVNGVKSIYEAAALKPVPGDTSGDKRVSMYDAALALKFSATPGVTGDAPSRADLDHDGVVTTRDSVLIGKKALGLN
ncbi:MAG: dockerin type I repeat-containing protein [Candidatus Omnitrophica bacterium]|nr:dockerin type I repeat-containing protein [Candidatus Omnitrophota bacterium]